METVGAGLQDHVHGAAGEASVLGGVAGSLHLELHHGVDGRPGLGGGAARILVVEAVDDEVGVVAAGAVDGEVRAAGALRLLGDAGNQVGEIGEVASVERNIRSFRG